MNTYVVKKEYNGKDLNSHNVNLKIDKTLNDINGLLYYNNTPICVNRSRVAKKYFVWNGDGCADERWELEQKIFSYWPYSSKIYDLVFSDTYKHLIREDSPDTILFNDYFYSSSHISELKDLLKDIENVSL